MYPRTFLDAYWKNDFDNRVFVAMSFSSEHKTRWEQIFKPAIASVSIGGTALQPYRVDDPPEGYISGDAIHTAILDGIAHSQLVMVDISAQHRWFDSTTGKYHVSSNDNVMIELGIALAWRQLTDVIVVRDSSMPSPLERPPFDITAIPYTTFDSDRHEESIKEISAVVVRRLNERSIQLDIRFRKVLGSLSAGEIRLLMDPKVIECYHDPTRVFAWTGPLGEMVGHVLFEKQLVRVVQIRGDEPPTAFCRLTHFGRAIIARLLTYSEPGTDYQVAPTYVSNE